LSTRHILSGCAVKIRWQGVELAEAKHLAASFCKNAALLYPGLPNQTGKAFVIPAGSMDDDPGMKPMHNIYYADKASWYVDVCELAKYDALPIK
jgi:hypothetical protein